MRFSNREEAGRQLAERLEKYRRERPIVVALPRGGVPVGYEIAKALGCPLDIIVARKLGAPHHEELAIGALSDGQFPQQVLHETLIRRLGVSSEYLRREIDKQLREIRRRETHYRGERSAPDLSDRAVIVVDDGIATGATMEAAIKSVRAQHPRFLVLAVPVAPAEPLERLREVVDEVVALHAPSDFASVGAFYVDFRQVEDSEVMEKLQPR